VIQLRPYQEEAVAAVEGAWREGKRRPLIALPTGTGKTICFAEAIRRRSGRALVVAHREELLQQARDKLALLVPRHRIGLVRAESDEHWAPVVVASVQTLARPERLRRLEPDFELVVVDEAHHATAETYRRLLARFDGALVMGCTATPERADRARLADVWDGIVYQRTLAEMIRAGYLCDLRARRVEILLDLDGIGSRGGDYAEGELEQGLRLAGAPQRVLEAYQRWGEGRKALLFTAGVGLAHEMAEEFEGAGIPAAAIDATTPREERAATLRAFATGELRVLANCGVLTEGYDEPSVECLILARPTKSRVLYAQMVGRGTRRFPGKDDCLILDLVGNSERHDLITIGSLFDFELEAGGSVLEQMAARAREEAQPAEVDGELVARELDLFDTRLHWAKGDGFWALSAGEGGVVVLVPREEGWSVLHLPRGRDEEEVVVASGLGLDYAQGAAEDLVRRLGGLGLVKRDAHWRNQPMTDAQRQALERWGLEWEPGMSRGEAADALTVAFAARVLEPATPRQRAALWRRGVQPPPGLTKRQASRLLAGGSLG
jgi:ATP-dependent helicase IRC3